MQLIPPALEQVIDELAKLPGIGPKSASRLAFYLVKAPPDAAAALADAIGNLHGSLRYCQQCFNFSEHETCAICQSPDRQDDLICVVEEPLDLVALERSGGFTGRYHVLHGAIAPIDGIGPDQLKIRELVERVGREHPREVIIATNPNLEGEATALYLQKQLGSLVPTLTRLASGLPMGAHLEYADELTLSRALAGRQQY